MALLIYSPGSLIYVASLIPLFSSSAIQGVTPISVPSDTFYIDSHWLIINISVWRYPQTSMSRRYPGFPTFPLLLIRASLNRIVHFYHLGNSDVYILRSTTCAAYYTVPQPNKYHIHLVIFCDRPRSRYNKIFLRRGETIPPAVKSPAEASHRNINNS